MGVVGAALATVISFAVSDIYLAWIVIKAGLLKPKNMLKVPDLADFALMIQEGSQLCLRTLSFSALTTIGSLLMAQRGSIIHSTYEICRQTTVLTYMIFLSLSQTIQTLAASCLGQKNLKMARDMINRTIQVEFDWIIHLRFRFHLSSYRL